MWRFKFLVNKWGSKKVIMGINIEVYKFLFIKVMLFGFCGLKILFILLYLFMIDKMIDMEI